MFYGRNYYVGSVHYLGTGNLRPALLSWRGLALQTPPSSISLHMSFGGHDTCSMAITITLEVYTIVRTENPWRWMCKPCSQLETQYLERVYYVRK